MQQNQHILAHAMPPRNHLQPPQTGHIPQIIPLLPHLILLPLQPLLLPPRRILDAETPVAVPGVDFVGAGRPGAHVGEDEGGVVAVEEVVEGFADGVEGDEGGDGEEADEVEEEVVVAADGVEEAEA